MGFWRYFREGWTEMGTLPRRGATVQWAAKHKDDWRKTSGVAFTCQPSLFVAHCIYSFILFYCSILWAAFALAAHNRTEHSFVYISTGPKTSISETDWNFWAIQPCELSSLPSPACRQSLLDFSDHILQTHLVTPFFKLVSILLFLFLLRTLTNIVH